LLLPWSLQYLNNFGDNYKVHKFDDAEKIATWSQHQPYKYVTIGEICNNVVRL
jgi:hypothetical protein